MVILTVELQGVAEVMLNNLVSKGYAKTKSEAIRQAVIHFGKEVQVSGEETQEDADWRRLAAKRALEDWDDAHKLFKF